MATAPSLSPRSPVRQLQVKEGCGLEDHNLYWLNTEPCGVACASFTWAIVLFSTYAFLVCTGSPMFSFYCKVTVV